MTRERDQDDIPDFETYHEEQEPDPDDETPSEDFEFIERGVEELDFNYDETYRGDPEWDPTQR